MNPETRKILLLGLNYVCAPPPQIATQARNVFEQELEKTGLSLKQFNLAHDATGEAYQFTCASHGAEIQLRVGRLPGMPLGQVLLQAQQPPVFELAQRQFEAAMRAVEAAWPQITSQIVRSDATMTVLYDASEKHAFTEIWEKLLGQPESALKRLGRPIAGGGLRFVMPPRPENPTEPVMELKIESFIPDSTKVFIEASFVWQQPSPPAERISSNERLKVLNDYVTKNAVSFFSTGGSA